MASSQSFPRKTFAQAAAKSANAQSDQPKLKRLPSKTPANITATLKQPKLEGAWADVAGKGGGIFFRAPFVPSSPRGPSGPLPSAAPGLPCVRLRERVALTGPAGPQGSPREFARALFLSLTRGGCVCVCCLVPSSAPLTPEETDQHRLEQREKQIQFGKSTLGYQRYLAAVPKGQRKKYEHPDTPDAKQKCSKRAWDGQVRVWRRALHNWDPAEEVAGKPMDSGVDGAPDEEEEVVDVAASDLGAFYEKDDDGTGGTSYQLPPVVKVTMEPMDFGNGSDSLLGQWAAGSNHSRSQGMELAGESCDPHALRDHHAEELVFVPFQFD